MITKGLGCYDDQKSSWSWNMRWWKVCRWDAWRRGEAGRRWC